ncbi:hypothetical protein C1H46_026972 [Malus baccata]|uniref:Uncharacterized protein n=1 Tax=Malus baccata TaxID=106549 RepID=A0A540LLW1_MALBA|nr:hypothetical protein C1H46_026972 [Malus baccata]
MKAMGMWCHTFCFGLCRNTKPAQHCTQPGLTVLSGFYNIGLAEDALGQDIGRDHVTEAATSGDERLAVVD